MRHKQEKTKISMYVCVYVCMYICVLYLHIYMRMHIHKYIYIDTCVQNVFDMYHQEKRKKDSKDFQALFIKIINIIP